MNDGTNDEYGASVGSVMAARKEYETVCAAEGSDSEAARRAHDFLTQQLEHRQTMRERHDASPPKGRNT